MADAVDASDAVFRRTRTRHSTVYPLHVNTADGGLR